MNRSAQQIVGLHEALAQRAAAEAPAGGLSRAAAGAHLSAVAAAMARTGAARLAAFEAWLADTLALRAPSPDAVHGLIGLGPGLTPSGDDVLVGALAMLDALGERRAHAALCGAIVGAPKGLTSPIGARMLYLAACGRIAEPLARAVAAVLGGNSGEAVATLRGIGHSSGWDMLAGITVALRAAAGSGAMVLAPAGRAD